MLKREKDLDAPQWTPRGKYTRERILKARADPRALAALEVLEV